MSDKDKIREMVMALARSKSDPSYLDVAREATAEVMASKTGQVTEAMFSEDSKEKESKESKKSKKSDDDDCECDDDDKSKKSDDDDDDDDDDGDDDDDDDSIKEGSRFAGAAKRHARAGYRDLNAKKKAIRSPVSNRAATNEAIDPEEKRLEELIYPYAKKARRARSNDDYAGLEDAAHAAVMSEMPEWEDIFWEMWNDLVQD